MTTYADSTRCPDCRSLLPQSPETCQVCSLPLTGDTATALFRTLQEADRLLGVLRTQKQPVPAVTATAASESRLDGLEPYPAPRRPAVQPAAPRVTGSSVPKILLSLGALCLLIAAVTFMVVAWAWLGVGGRTIVLVALTATSLGLSVTLLRHGLRMAAEALSVVGLGLLAIDVTGARTAGWLGTIDDAQLTLVAGTTLATVALALLVASAARPLIAPALIAPFAVLVATVGAQAPMESPLPTFVAVVVLLALARIGTVLPSTTLQMTSLSTGALAWLYGASAGYETAPYPITAAHYFGDLACWPILAATVTIAAVGPITGVRRVELAGYAVAGLVGTYGVLLPVMDNEPTAMTSAVLAASAAWVVVLMIASHRFRPVALLPLASTLVVPAVAAAGLATEALRALTSVGEPFTQPFDVSITSAPTYVSPLLMVPTGLVIAAAVCAAGRLVAPLQRSTWAIALAGAFVGGTVLTLPLYDVRLAAIVGLLVAGAVCGFGAAERMMDVDADITRMVGLALVTGAALLALPSDQMVSAVLLVACLIAGYLMTRSDSTGAAAAACFPVAYAALVWAGGNALGVDGQLRAIPVLLVLGGLVIWRPQLELDVSSALAATVVSAASVSLAPDVLASLAVHLTLAGVLVTASSIANPSRRMLAWLGGLILVVDTWVRLYDVGIRMPEAYTLPSALALTAVGAWRLRQDDESATLTVLAPGLILATVPSLIATLDDPSSLRAMLLGATCLALIVVGAAFHWSAPLVVGAVVGGLLALLELAPYAAEVPTWLSLGVSGVVLLVVGITWESRMNDVRRASRYVAALR